MNARLLWIPVALLAAVAFVATDEAEASPLKAVQRAAREGTQLGPRIRIGGGIHIPITSRRHGHYREIVEYTGGFYETRTREVEVPGEQIGWDFEGRPIYGPARVEVQTYRVWIPRRRIVRRVWVPHRVRHHGHISIGGGFRFR